MNMVMRQMSIEMACCVQIVDHVSQNVARSGIMDQHVGRGGTAKADNSRGQRQLVRVTAREFTYREIRYKAPPQVTDEDLQKGRYLILAVHKLSYVELDPTPTFIYRDGFRFEHALPEALGRPRQTTANEDMETIAGFIERKLANNERLPASVVADVHSKEIGLPRVRVRELVKEGLRTGRFAMAELPAAERQGSKTEYLITQEVEYDDISAET